MAPPTKRRRLSKANWKKLKKEKGEQSAKKRGTGTGSRKTFSLPARWKEVTYKSGGRTRLQFESPGKTSYKTQKQVEAVLASRNLQACLNDHCTSSEEDIESAGSEYVPTDEEKPMCEKSTKAPLERRFFVCESTQLLDLVHQVNATSKCSTKDCNGK